MAELLEIASTASISRYFRANGSVGSFPVQAKFSSAEVGKALVINAIVGKTDPADVSDVDPVSRTHSPG